MINILVVVLIFLITALWLNSYLPGIISGWKNHIVTCVDFGQYLSELKKYSINPSELKSIAQVGKEPGFLITGSALVRIANINPKTVIIILEFLNHMLTGMGLFIITVRLLPGEKKNKIYAFLPCLFYGLVFLNTTWLMSLAGRQNGSNMFLLLFLFCFIFFKKNFGHIIIIAILIGGSFIYHRFGIVLGIGGFILYGLLCIKEKKYGEIKRMIKIILLFSIIVAPYLVLQMGDILDTIQWYFFGKYEPIEAALTPYSNSSNQHQDLGWNAFDKDGVTEKLPIIYLFIREGFIYLILLTQLENIYKNPNTRIYTALIAFIIIYTCTYLVFSIRVLNTLEIVLLPLVGFCLSQMKNRGYIMITYILIFLLATLSIVYKSGINRLYNISTDQGLIYLEKNINPKKSILLGDFCVIELAPQIGYRSAHELSDLPLWNRTSLQGEGFLSYYHVVKVFRILLNSIGEKGYVHNILSGNDIYIVFTKGMNQNDINLMNQGKHIYLSSPNMNLVFKSDNNTDYIRYIYKVKLGEMTFFDNINYAELNLINVKKE